MKKKRDQASQNWLGAASFILIIFVAMVGLLMFQLPYSNPYREKLVATVDSDTILTPVTDCIEWSDDADPMLIEAAAAIELPQSVRDLSVSPVAFLNCSVNVSFAMNADDLQTFLASTYVGELHRRDGSQLLIPNHNLYWNFDTETPYLYGHGQPENSEKEHQYIVIDTTDENIYIVYVMMMYL